MDGSNIKPESEIKKNKIADTLYVNFRSIKLTKLFIYAVAIGITFILTKYLNLNIYLTLPLAIFLVLLDISKVFVFDTVQSDNILSKLSDISPHPVNFSDYPDLIELFYALRRISQLNFKEYSRVIYNVDAVIALYNNVLTGVTYCKHNYDVAKDRARDALNAMHGLIYSIETNPYVTQKYHDALKALKKILNAFLTKIRSICKNRRENKGWDHTANIIFPGPEPYSNNKLNEFEYY